MPFGSLKGINVFTEVQQSNMYSFMLKHVHMLSCAIPAFRRSETSGLKDPLSIPIVTGSVL